MAQRNRFHSIIWVCTDCLFAREGDGNPERPADLPAEWSTVDFTKFDVSLGRLTHEDYCPRATDDPACDGPECTCDRDDFSTRACEGCGTHHHGERQAYTLWTV